jgi:hypothetical protein
MYDNDKPVCSEFPTFHSLLVIRNACAEEVEFAYAATEDWRSVDFVPMKTKTTI